MCSQSICNTHAEATTNLLLMFGPNTMSKGADSRYVATPHVGLSFDAPRRDEHAGRPQQEVREGFRLTPTPARPPPKVPKTP